MNTRRVVVNVATGAYIAGQRRLASALGPHTDLAGWAGCYPPGSPSHREKPYAFKAWALKRAAEQYGATELLWADACILPVQDMEPLWEKIALDGAWISRNGWNNSEWTADSAYKDLGVSREENALVPHVVATTFGLSLAHPTGKALLEEYFRLAQTEAFCGPWWNSNHPEYVMRNGSQPCGPPTTLGHRHDQTALSLIAWRLGVELTDPPAWFSYAGGQKDTTVLIADASYMR